MFQRVISLVAALWMQRNTTLSTEKSGFFLDIISQTLDIFVLAFYHFLWVEYGPVGDSLVFHQACQWGLFFGALLVE